MQKILRILVICFLLFVVGGIVYTQTQLLDPHEPAKERRLTQEQQAVAEIAARNPSPAPTVEPASAAVTTPAAIPASSATGTESSPVVVRILPGPDAADAAGERSKNREIGQRIERDTARLAAAALAQNFLLLFQAIIYFLTLIILFLLLENVKKFAEAASKSAEAAKISAEAAAQTLERAAKPASSAGRITQRLHRRR